MSTIAAGITSGTALVSTGDTTGALVLQTNGTTTAVTIGTNQVVTLAQPLPVASGGTGATSLSGITTGTATNLAGGSNGTIPYQSAAGTTQMLAVGSAGQLLQTNGAGAPSWVTASSGALVYLSTVTASSSATVDVETTFSSTYDTYVIIADSVRLSVDGNNIYCRLKLGGTYVTSADYAYHQQVSRSNSTAYGATASQSNTFIEIFEAGSNAAGASMNFTMFVRHPASTSLCKVLDWHGGMARGGSSAEITNGVGTNPATTALTGVRFLPPSGTISSGTFRLYGIANS